MAFDSICYVATGGSLFEADFRFPVANFPHFRWLLPGLARPFSKPISRDPVPGSTISGISTTRRADSWHQHAKQKTSLGDFGKTRPK
jgi:hypothetical protein